MQTKLRQLKVRNQETGAARSPWKVGTLQPVNVQTPTREFKHVRF
jgi:hypothetical protein